MCTSHDTCPCISPLVHIYIKSHDQNYIYEVGVCIEPKLRVADCRKLKKYSCETQSKIETFHSSQHFNERLYHIITNCFKDIPSGMCSSNGNEGTCKICSSDSNYISFTTLSRMRRKLYVRFFHKKTRLNNVIINTWQNFVNKCTKSRDINSTILLSLELSPTYYQRYLRKTIIH